MPKYILSSELVFDNQRFFEVHDEYLDNITLFEKEEIEKVVQACPNGKSCGVMVSHMTTLSCTGVRSRML